ncbi:DUF551 domain-containing protein [Pseudomonas tohonis]|uniref:DUF551 domain-containing protein n=1 Tax=Pseudomonas tohonis TaxID=2725477 RepID=UPI001F18C148|nr:DUF551 domain-containing protein [Pseudomonas tohonis]
MSEWIDLEIQKPPRNGFFLVTVDTDDGACVRAMEYVQKRDHFIDEGEPTHCHGYYFSPTHWQELPKPAVIVRKDED